MTNQPHACDKTQVNAAKTEVVSQNAYREFPIEALPDPCRVFVSEASKAIGCDPSYVGVPLLATLAGTIGNSAVIELKRGWCEPSVIWSAVIGESGTTKSPALDCVLSPLQRTQLDLVRDHQHTMADHEQALAMHAADFASWKAKGRGKGEPPPEEPPEPTCQRIIVSDTTVEALAVILAENPRGLLLARDELAGMLLGMNQYRGGKGADAQHFLTMHGARALVIDRKGSSGSIGKKLITVPRAALSIAGTIQPTILRQALGRDHFENGLAARFLFAAPPPKAKRWTEAELSEGAERQLADLHKRLLFQGGVPDEWGEISPQVLSLTPSGRAAWITFYNEHAERLADLSGDMAATWAKLEGYAARLALVIHLVRREWFDLSLESPDAIDEASISAGVILSRWFAGEAERLYGLFGETDDQREQRELIEWIRRKGGTVTVRDLARSRRFAGRDHAEAEIAKLVSAGLGSWRFIPPGEQGGRPTSEFVLGGLCHNPS